ncbi:MAG: acyltransferase [Rhodococcus sp.]|nr:acyltransferase [Rhodococcus sp. (in: high G+C Gram-positive bacteria)]
MCAARNRTIATGGDRDRLVDFLRAFAICVVIVWHWSLSIVHRDADGILVMPNPLADLPFFWPATWVLQVVPLFFIAGGYANLTMWRSIGVKGYGWREFYRRRFRRLLIPVAVFVAVWTVFELIGQLFVSDYRSAAIWADIVFRPMWFVVAYAWVVLLVPLTARLHEHRPALTICALGVTVALVDGGGFGLDISWLGWVNSALVWVFVHQLGYALRDGFGAAWSVGRRLAFLGTTLAVLTGLTSLESYPSSLVAHRDTALSRMYPTTAVVGAAAVFQLSIALLARPWLERCGRGRAWAGVEAINDVVLTLFLWHMTALVLAVWTVERLGFGLEATTGAAWWLNRPLWVFLPALFLAALVALFAPFERRSRFNPLN